MKNLFIVLLMLVSLTSYSQTLQFEEVKTTSQGFDVESGSNTSTSIEIEGKTYNVFATSKGSKYIKLTSTKGNIYPLWIGEETEETYKDYPVRRSSKGTYFILLVGKSGNPYCKYLKVK